MSQAAKALGVLLRMHVVQSSLVVQRIKDLAVVTAVAWIVTATWV